MDYFCQQHLKRFLLLILIAIMFIGGLQQPSCACYSNANSTCVSTINEHSCCHKNEFNSTSGIYFCELKHCCGIFNNNASVTGSFVRIISARKEFLQKFIPINYVHSLRYETNRFLLSRASRSPPNIASFGSSQKYLYKCAFLM